MKLYCKVSRGLGLSWLDRISSKLKWLNLLFDVAEEDPDVQRINLFLTEPGSKRMLDSQVLAQAFGSMVYRLTEGRSIRLLFPRGNQAGSVKRELKKIDVQWSKERKWLRVDAGSIPLPRLIQILEALSFAYFYADIGEKENGTRRPSSLLQDMQNRYFLIVFCLFDENIEILSRFLTSELVLKAAGEVGKEMGFEVAVAD